MKTTIKIPRRKGRSTLKEVIPFLNETLGEFEGRTYAGRGWRFQIKAWKDIGMNRTLPDMVYGGDTEPAHYLLDVWDPAAATLIALRFA